MKKLLLLITLILIFISCDKSKSKKAEKIKEEIVSKLPVALEYLSEESLIKYGGEKFYFIYGFDYDGNPATNIRYRGILYSDKLAEYGYPGGLEIGLDDLELEEGDVYTMAGNYLGLLMSIEIDSIVENKAKEIFGKKTNLYNDGSMNKKKYQKMINERKMKLNFQDKSGYYSTIVNVFVDDLDKLDNDDIKKKTFELAKFIYNDMNYVTALQVYVRDNKYFENYNLVYSGIYEHFREKEDVKLILDKIKNKEKLNDEERETLERVFNKGGLDFNISHYKFFLLSFDEEKEIPIKLNSVSYESEVKNSEVIYLKWKDKSK